MNMSTYTPTAKYDAQADAAIVRFAEGRPSAQRFEELDETRFIHRDEAGRLLEVELLDLSERVNLEGLPEPDAVRAALEEIVQGMENARATINPDPVWSHASIDAPGGSDGRFLHAAARRDGGPLYVWRSIWARGWLPPPEASREFSEDFSVIGPKGSAVVDQIAADFDVAT
ncbi:unnamed protein product, partial [marine sediment metagenome]